MGNVPDLEEALEFADEFLNQYSGRAPRDLVTNAVLRWESGKALKWSMLRQVEKFKAAQQTQPSAPGVCECKSCQENYGIPPSAPDLEAMVEELLELLSSAPFDTWEPIVRTFAAKVALSTMRGVERKGLDVGIDSMDFAHYVDDRIVQLRRLAGEE